jgi:hypothetical protein
MEYASLASVANGIGNAGSGGQMHCYKLNGSELLLVPRTRRPSQHPFIRFLDRATLTKGTTRRALFNGPCVRVSNSEIDIASSESNLSQLFSFPS